MREGRALRQSQPAAALRGGAPKRETEDDTENFRAAFEQLTNNQRMELMNILTPAINNGAIKVEVIGLLF